MSWLVSSSENWVLEHRPVLAAIQELLLVWLCVQTMKDLWGPREATAQLHDRILFPANAVSFILPAWCIKQPPTFPSGPLCCSLVPLFHLTRWQKWCPLPFSLDSTSKMQARPDSWEWHSDDTNKSNGKDFLNGYHPSNSYCNFILFFSERTTR